MKRQLPFLLVTTFVALLLIAGACAPGNTPAPTASPAPAHWTYEGEEGPAHWGELDPSYEMCGVGKNQSPIDISSPNEQDLANITFHYQPSEVKILNNGHTAQVNYDAGSYIELDGVRYDVAQFHYHAPSEHEVDGKSFAAEFHIVHKSADGKLAVVGLLLQEGAANAAVDPFINNLPAEKSEVVDAGVKINAMDFLPSSRTTYRYSGSLTTPPCSEGVNWLVMTTPVELSSAQLSKLESLFEANNRPVQPLNDRTLTEDSTP
ncbi:MAG: carbonic anhydrase family protein [Caldilineales bacterium]|nr:carbonic anhydrase family protein [Caldilineales bacterium]